MKGERAFVWVSAVVVLVRSLLLPICVFYMSMDVASRTRVLSWPSEITVDGRIDGREPHVLVGKTTGMCWALWGVKSCLPKLSRVWALPMTTSSLLCKEEMGVKEPSPQACRLLWMSATGLSPGSLLLCLSLASSSASRGRTLAKATGAWQLVHVDADVLVEREINTGPFKAW